MAQRRSGSKPRKKPEPERRQLSGWVQLVFLALLVGAAGALWFGRDQVSALVSGFAGGGPDAKAARNAGRGVPVVVARAGGRANDLFIDAIATARAKRFVTLYPEVAGEIMEMKVRAGDRVKAGGVVMKLDSRDAELAVKLAKVRVREAELALSRAQRLLERNVNSVAKVQDAQTILERTTIELEQAYEALSKRTLRAPFDGVLGIPKVEAGDRVSSATAIITVDDRSELLVEIEVPEEYLAHIAEGQTVFVRTPSFAERRFEGTVEKIDSRIAPDSRTVMVRAALPNPGDLLRPGMSFAVELKIPGDEFATVPELALQWGGGQSYVWRVNGDTVEKLQVRSVKRLNRIVLVDGDVRRGDLIVVEGVQRLRPGRKVRFTMPKSVPSS